MKILHVSCMRELTSGQRKQLQYEYKAAKELCIEWKVVALHTGEIVDKRFEIRIPKAFRGLFLKNMYGWLYLLKHHKKFDIVLNRHMLFDPFVLVFGWFIKNRLSVHHAKESESLKAVDNGWKGILTSYIEKITGYIGLKQVIGTVSVTNEIAMYHKSCIPMFVYPNGIDLNEISLLEDKRIKNEINVAFICTYFAAWQGLDLLLQAAMLNAKLLKQYNVKLHLIGKIYDNDKAFIEKYNLSQNVISYGVLDFGAYKAILEECDIGLNSLALERENLAEGSSLKVREYLSYGLPIFSRYKDTAIPTNFKFYKISKLNFQEIINFSLSMKLISREEVRKSSEAMINKTHIVEKLYKEVENTFINIKAD